MPRIFHPLILLLSRMTQQEMAQMVDFLKTENRMLRAKAPPDGVFEKDREEFFRIMHLYRRFGRSSAFYEDLGVQ
jgi:hypothetical protein